MSNARWTKSEMAGFALVGGAAILGTSGSRLPDQSVYEGLLVACLLWSSFSGVGQRTAGFALVAAGVFAVAGAMTLVLGQGTAALMPFAVTVHHVGLVMWALYREQRAEHSADERPRSRGLFERRMNEHLTLRRESAKLDDDPFRSPPQTPPIVVRAQLAPPKVPVESDETAPKPKLLG